MAKRIKEYLHERIAPPGRKSSLNQLRRTEWCNEFIKLMRNRLIMGALRYTTMRERFSTNHGYDCTSSAIERLQKYQETGNTEHLVDVANLCMLEFDAPSNSKAHWNPIDDGKHVGKKQ